MSIPADHITIDGDTAWLVFGDDDNERMFLPAEWATDLDRPCDTCDGHGELEDNHPVWGAVMGADCPDCIDGRHTFDIDVDHSPYDGYFDTHHVSIVPGMVMPIVTMTRAMSDDPIRSLYVIHNPVEPTRGVIPGIPDANHETLITLPPAAKPGMWAVKLKVAS